MDIAAWHLQSTRYDDVRPPSFGEHPHLTSLERERERNEATFEEIENQIDEALEKENQESNESMASRFSRWQLRRRKNDAANNNNNSSSSNNNNNNHNDTRTSTIFSRMSTRKPKTASKFEKRIQGTKKSINAPISPKLGKKKKKKTHKRASSSFSCVTSYAKQSPNEEIVDEKPLFLQEAVHLLSLLSAVALSTLRNDLENAESPLITFHPGTPFPSVDPDSINADIREGWGEAKATLRFATLRYLLGSSRNETNRAIYNAARPFRVIGGVSDAEIEMLQAARGPLAKVALCSMWLEEFISRYDPLKLLRVPTC